MALQKIFEVGLGYLCTILVLPKALIAIIRTDAKCLDHDLQQHSRKGAME